MTEQEHVEMQLLKQELSEICMGMRAHNNRARRDKDMIPVDLVAGLMQSLMRVEIMCGRPVEKAKPKTYRSMGTRK